MSLLPNKLLIRGSNTPLKQETMSLYNMVNKVNPATFFILPMLGVGHAENFPRFRDCFVTAHHWVLDSDNWPRMLPVDEKEKPTFIYVLLRVGGSNRSSYSEEIGRLQTGPNYSHDIDDEFDTTYAHFVFNVPEEWKEDYEKVTSGRMTEVSDNYKHLITITYPKLQEKLKEVFNNQK